MTRIYDP